MRGNHRGINHLGGYLGDDPEAVGGARRHYLSLATHKVLDFAADCLSAAPLEMADVFLLASLGFFRLPLLTPYKFVTHDALHCG